MTEREARKRYKSALDVGCDSCFRRSGEWCVSPEGATWSLCMRRIDLGAANDKIVDAARRGYMAGAADVRRNEIGDSFRIRETPIEVAFNEWWKDQS